MSKILLLKYTERGGTETVTFFECREREEAVTYVTDECKRSEQSSNKLVSAVLVEGEILCG